MFLYVYICIICILVCTEPEVCQRVFCLLHCENGYDEDDNGCRVCQCAMDDDREECPDDLRVVYNACRRECLTKTEQDCIACNSSCNSTCEVKALNLIVCYLHRVVFRKMMVQCSKCVHYTFP